jgi:ubiquinone/menaquinone biosynthesis C-methylase UbiE
MAYMRDWRKKKDIAITGLMAKWYDNNTRKFRLGEMMTNATIVSNFVLPGANILEVAPGPGYLSIELAKRGFVVTGVELSLDFVEMERVHAADEGVNVDFRQGNASMLPLLEESYDFIICSAAFKNFSEPLKALQEMYRVLRPGGAALILDMNRNNTKEDIDDVMRNYPDMKGFDRWFVKLSFKTFLRSGAYSREEFEAFIAETAFPRNEIKKNGIGFQIWLYKA